MLDPLLNVLHLSSAHLFLTGIAEKFVVRSDMSIAKKVKHI